MENRVIQKIGFILFIAICLPIIGHAIETDSATRVVGINKPLSQRRFIHKIGIGFRPEYIVPTNPFLGGVNHQGKQISKSLSANLRYAFQSLPGSLSDYTYGGVYQGIGISGYDFGSKDEIGNPYAIYLFQGARIARISRNLSLNYEWNFGLSWGWKPYNPDYNEFNIMMGSKINAYLNVNFLLQWTLSRHLDLQAGFSMTHFSNGNTSLPNAGLNTIGGNIGLLYNIGREKTPSVLSRNRVLKPKFTRHISYDLMFFGSWCSSIVFLNDKPIISPEKYTVLGFNFSPMYNFGYKFRAGISLDGVYNGSANIYTEDYIIGMGEQNPGYTFYRPGIDKQLSLGLSARGEFVMPYFTVGIGLGINALHKGGDLKAFYQIFALKVAVTRSSFIHIGYCLKNFQTPNYLMLGVGYRFNNKSNRVH